MLLRLASVILLVAPLHSGSLELPYGKFHLESEGRVIQLRLSKGRQIEIIQKESEKPYLSARGWYRASRRAEFSFDLWLYPVEVTTSKWPTKLIRILKIPIEKEKKIKVSLDYLEKGKAVKLCLHYTRIEGTPWLECVTLKREHAVKTGDR